MVCAWEVDLMAAWRWLEGWSLEDGEQLGGVYNTQVTDNDTRLDYSTGLEKKKQAN